jgi:uncharacterized protein
VASFNLRTVKLRPGEQFVGPAEIAFEPLELGGERYRQEPPTAEGNLTVTRTTSGTLFELSFDTTLRGPCMRCLADASVVVRIRAREYDERNAKSEELESPYVVDDRIDLSAWGRDAVALALPDKLLCKEDCAGLCPSCGANRNESPCACEPAAPDERWAKLSELRDLLT